MINKNKEEIEKIEKGCNKKEKHPFGIHYEECGKNKWLCPTCQRIKQATIKTSIEWCEDEIEFLEGLYIPTDDYGDGIKQREETENRYEQLQSHLKWLKQKRGQDD